MKKKTFFKTIPFILGLFILLNSCDETGADGLIDFTIRTKSLKDTDYVAIDTNATTQKKAVFIEDFTGNNCLNCPDAAIKIKELKRDHGKRIVSVAIHAGAENFVNPYPNYSQYDFRTTAGTNIYELFGGGSLPIGAVDRLLYDGETKINHDRSKWRPHAEERLNLETPVNISIMIDSFNQDKINFRVKLFYNQAVAEDHYLSVFITEDSIIDHQTSGLDHIQDYQHDHVFRTSATNFSGDLITAPLDKNRVIIKFFEVPIEKGQAGDTHIKYWNYKNLNVLAFVNARTSDDYPVIHVVQEHVK